MTWRDLIWRLLKAYPLRPWFRWRHRCCLRRIAALEKLNDPTPKGFRFQRTDWTDDLDMAVWPVSDPSAIQFYQPNNFVQILSGPWAKSGAAVKHKAEVERVLFGGLCTHQPTERSVT